MIFFKKSVKKSVKKMMTTNWTDYYNKDMDENEAADIICYVFPRWFIFRRSLKYINQFNLEKALWIASKKCGSNMISECIKWARNNRFIS